MLDLLRRTFSRYNSHHSKKLLYIHLVRSQLIYCSQIWRRYLLKDITVLENVERRGTKFILNDFTADYKTLLLSLNLLPLAIIMLYELNDILFFIKSLKKPTAAFHILDYVSFCSNSTRSASLILLNLSINALKIRRFEKSSLQKIAAPKNRRSENSSFSLRKIRRSENSSFQKFVTEKLSLRKIVAPKNRRSEISSL